MTISVIISIDKNIIQIYNTKNIKLLSKYLVNISLKACRYIYQSKKYYLVLEMAISSLKYYLLFIIFANSYLMIFISKVKLDKLLTLPNLSSNFLTSDNKYWFLIIKLLRPL